MENEIRTTVTNKEDVKVLTLAAKKLKKQAQIHYKLDTGMSRMGLGAEELFVLMEDNQANNFLKVEGLYTHFATADSADKSYAQSQLEIYRSFLKSLQKEGIAFNIQHAANSAAIIDMPESHFDMVRAGISLYGFYPSEEVDKSRIELRPAMTLKSRIAHLKTVPAGFKLSYGITYETKQPTTIATVPIGYADGLNRLQSSRGHMLVGGRRAPIVGRVCMDQAMLDVGHIQDVKFGDEVVVFGKQGKEEISVEEVASHIQSINYEIVCAVTGRVVRQYLE